MRILSIQSSVAYGHVGNSAATFPLQRLGHEVSAVSTVHFSNHTGYGAWRGIVLDPAVVADVIQGIDDRGALVTSDAVLTGYQGSPGVAGVVLQTLERIRAANPNVKYCCDPVLGDVGRGFFVLPGIPELMRDEVVPQADIVTPNAFELAYLAGVTPAPTAADGPPFRRLEEVIAAAEAVRALGPETVLVTSVTHEDLPPGHLAMVLLDGNGAHQVITPVLPISVNGAGDLTAAVFLAHLLTGDPVAALAKVAATVHAVLELTVARGSREIELIGAQQHIADPAPAFPVQAIPVTGNIRRPSTL